MPQPRPHEKINHYIPRAVKHMISVEGLTQDQALGKAYGMWRERKKEKDEYSKKVDKKMHSFGDIDDRKKIIRVNPKKGDLLNTILHEEEHKKHPKKKESKLTPKTAINLLRGYTKK